MSEISHSDRIQALVARCREIVGCYSARIISTSGGTMFLVIGTVRNMDGDDGQWLKNSGPYGFGYASEKVVASGETEEGLLASAREYKRLCEYHTEVLASCFGLK